MSQLPAELINFNKVFVALKGQGILNCVELIGTEEQIATVVQEEVEYFSKHNVSALYMLSDKDLVTEPNTVYFFPENGCKQLCNEIDISSVSSGVTYEAFRDALGLAVSKDLYNMYIKDRVKSEDDLKKAVNDILLKHYENGNFEDKSLHRSDLEVLNLKNDSASDALVREEREHSRERDWERERARLESSRHERPRNEEARARRKDAVNPIAKANRSTGNPIAQMNAAESNVRSVQPEHTQTPEDQTHKAEKDDSAAISAQNVKDNTPDQNKPKEKPSISEQPAPERSETVHSASNKEDAPATESKDSSAVPEPKKVVSEQPKNCKSELSDEENTRNKELLLKIKEEYSKTIQFIESLCNPQWGTLLNYMKDCVSSNLFNKQWCKMYLETSDDISTPLYANLYELDKNTLAYNNEVVHQIKKLGCFNCGKDWEEDITFLEKGAHYIKCPHCGQSRGFEKE